MTFPSTFTRTFLVPYSEVEEFRKAMDLAGVFRFSIDEEKWEEFINLKVSRSYVEDIDLVHKVATVAVEFQRAHQS